jgi:predicted CXXCH cytochrome family protein
VKLLLITRDPQRGTQVKKTLSADWVRVGRKAGSEIYLPDPRIALEQGMIVFRDGLVYLEGETGVVTKNTTRKSVRSVRLRFGEPIDIGPYQLESLDPPAGFDGAVSVELVRPLEVAPGLASRTSRLTLGSLGLTKRWAAWGLGLAILVAFLIVPAARVLELPWARAGAALGLGDRMWNPGPVTLAHQPIEKQCATCHEVAFQHVKDRACLECHSKIGHHVAADLKPAALFDGARCTTCHREHKGVKTTHRDDDSFCVACHRDIGAKTKAAHAKNVSDFARDHPDFQLTLAQGEVLQRVRQGTQPIVQQSNLKFPHATHLDPRGVKSPGKGRVRLECAACHKPDASARSFEPLSMAKHCQECHGLQFEPAVTTREVPHGKPAEAITVIEEFYSNLALKGVRDSFQKAFGVAGEGLLRRVGDPSPAERQDALALASRKAKQVSAELFEVRVCKTCHEVSGAKGGEWRIAPIAVNPSWMPHARFNHKAHAQAKCAECHDAAGSKRASDVAMPTIEKCRACHGGSRPVEGKVTSNCLLCHGFHDAAHAWDPQFKPRGAQRVAEGAGSGR